MARPVIRLRNMRPRAFVARPVSIGTDLALLICCILCSFPGYSSLHTQSPARARPSSQDTSSVTVR